MQKSKINSLFVIFLALAITFPSLTVFAQGQGGNQPTSTQATSSKQFNGENHKSEVAKFVKTLLDVADRQGNGIGQQVRTIAQEQNQSASTTIQAMEKVQKRSKIKTFFIGSDYKNLGALRSEIVKTESRLEQLNRLVENAQNDTDKTELQGEIQTLQQEQQKIESFVKTNESNFSLFGWVTKLFSK